MGGPGYFTLREDIRARVRAELDATVAALPEDVHARAEMREGDPAGELVAASHELDALVLGSRGYGPLHAVLAGGVSGRVAREAACPVIVVPRGADTSRLLPAAAAADATA
jgi:nucleotide-binding universal stress UspA family protein